MLVIYWQSVDNQNSTFPKIELYIIRDILTINNTLFKLDHLILFNMSYMQNQMQMHNMYNMSNNSVIWNHLLNDVNSITDRPLAFDNSYCPFNSNTNSQNHGNNVNDYEDCSQNYNNMRNQQINNYSNPQNNFQHNNRNNNQQFFQHNQRNNNQHDIRPHTKINIRTNSRENIKINNNQGTTNPRFNTNTKTPPTTRIVQKTNTKSNMEPKINVSTTKTKQTVNINSRTNPTPSVVNKNTTHQNKNVPIVKKVIKNDNHDNYENNKIKPIVKKPIVRTVVEKTIKYNDDHIPKANVKQYSKPIAKPDVKVTQYNTPTKRSIMQDGNKYVVRPRNKPEAKPVTKVIVKPENKKKLFTNNNNNKKIDIDDELNSDDENNKCDEDIESEQIEYENTILGKLCELSDASINVVLKEFVDMIYENTHCIGGKYNGKTYKELPNEWSKRKAYTPTERKYKCEGDDCDDCTVEDEINEYVDGPVQIVWDFNSIKKDLNINLDIDEKKHSHLNKSRVLGFMKTLSHKRSEYFFNGIINIKSNAYDSEDHRGSDHCLIMLPNDTDITLENPTLEEFVESLYLCKTKKFDDWYEMYTGCNVINKKNGDITISTKFEYGS